MLRRPAEAVTARSAATAAIEPLAALTCGAPPQTCVPVSRPDSRPSPPRPHLHRAAASPRFQSTAPGWLRKDTSRSSAVPLLKRAHPPPALLESTPDQRYSLPARGSRGHSTRAALPLLPLGLDPPRQQAQRFPQRPLQKYP